MKTLIGSIIIFAIGNLGIWIAGSIYYHEIDPTHWPIYVKTERATDKLIMLEVLVFIIALISSAFDNESED
jgi:hypothetical protein